MPTEITIELYDKLSDDNRVSWKQAMLEHFAECSPEAMGADLERRLADVDKALVGHFWTGQRVAAVMVMQSAEDRGCGGVPTIEPCVRIDRGCEYVWKVYLGPSDRQYDLRCFAAEYDRKHGCMLTVREVDWRAGKKI